jgi:LacI family transcriptional regulator
LFIVHRRSFSDAKDPFYPYIMQGLEEVLTEEGYSVILVTMDDSQLKAGPTEMRVIQEQRPSAIVLAGPDISRSFILDTAALDITTVLVDNALSDTSIPAVLQDNKEGCRLATNHLIEVHGHEQIALLRGPTWWITSEERTTGYMVEMETAGLQPSIFLMDDTTIETGREAARQALQAHPGLTAMVAINDAMAIGAMHTASELGLIVPEDLAIVGFDNISWAAYTIPPLTTVSVPMKEMGRLAAQALLDGKLRSIGS